MSTGITCEERPTSRRLSSGDTNTRELLYVVRGTSDEDEALDAVQKTSPEVYRGLIRQGIDLEPVFTDDSNRDNPEPGEATVLGEGIWYATARYGLVEAEYSYSTGGGSLHITQSLETVKGYAREGETPPDFKGAIGVTKDSVEGVDIPVPAEEWSETYYLEDALVTAEYRALLKAYTGCANGLALGEHEAGEVRLKGAKLSTKGRYAVGETTTRYWQLTLDFEAQENQYYITIGEITGIEKQGWDYLWVRYEETVDTAGLEVVKVPKAVYVERVIPRVDLNQLYIW